MKKNISILAVILILSGVAALTSAQTINTLQEVSKLGQEGIVAASPCTGVVVDARGNPTGLGCQLCDLVRLADRLVYWMVLFSFGIATLLFIYGGYFIMFYGASEHLYAQGKQIILGTVVGLMIVLTSWIIINTIFSVLIDDNNKMFRPWSAIQCAGNPLSTLPK